jgi:uncharacterized protein with beta-barrel porin domain
LDAIFIDGLVGYGDLSFGTRRFDLFSGAALAGSRTGQSLFGTLSVSTKIGFGSLHLSPYLRGEVISSSFNPYREYGNEDWALRFGKTATTQASAILGLRGSMPIPTSFGLLTPTIRLEYQHRLDDTFKQGLSYASGETELYAVQVDRRSRSHLSGTVGLRAALDETMSVDIEYGSTADLSRIQSQSVRARFGLRW